MAELTYEQFLDISYNPKRVGEKRALMRRWALNTPFFAKAEMLSTDTNVRQITFGAVQSDWMNYDTEVFSLLPKEPWGPRSGMRFYDLTASRASGIQETGNLKTASLSTPASWLWTLARPWRTMSTYWPTNVSITGSSGSRTTPIGSSPEELPSV